MFKKKTLEEFVTPLQINVPDLPVEENESSVGKQISRRCTIIASNTLFVGNIDIEGEIHIYGRVQGNISLRDGVVYVMRDGFLEGEFTAPSFVINGRVQGTCIGESVEVHEHGEMEGIIRSEAFSIRPGGCFIGTSERLTMNKETESKRVVGIKKNQSTIPQEIPKMKIDDATCFSQIK